MINMPDPSQQTPSTQSGSPYSYVDEYFPPVDPASNPSPAAVPAQSHTAPQTSSAPARHYSYDPSEASTKLHLDSPSLSPQIDDSSDSAPATSSQSQSLEDQNIFFLLGVSDATEKEQEDFLDELQQVIWEDFLDQDMELLLTSDEYQQANAILNKEGSSELEKQEDLIVFLEKLIPDLEDIMLEKALELKEEMFKERLSSLKDFFQGDPQHSQKVEEAEKLMKQNLWLDASTILNKLPVTN